MRNIKFFMLVMALGLLTSTMALAQKPKTVKLEQTTGEFTTESLKLKAGTPYVFEVSNKDVDHAVGFVLAPKKDNIAMEDHIQAAYLSKTIEAGEVGKSQEVVLEAGEYVFFCPLNPTPQYTVVVK